MLQYSIVSTLCYSSYGRLWCRSSCTGYPSNASVRVRLKTMGATLGLSVWQADDDDDDDDGDGSHAI